ncbi:hypothetical protein HanXRQr2_Chr02g0060821 [Helianthus annuus]|uniref:Uncharacterized protein n=1 Tax=Helianthus annuus TaxID=4232 RepID=A0A251VGB4_HELAN|nr:hypothetical protein HanXRQr2_Chr02g0060821 [Helianthus annuus]KAJ0604454.1 hypothetical protein HanHA300_Chr02g0050041 [Helianthus annuus]KAJ0951431.1 hypothetical protein HanPSC8_Chr02g0059911 [Helianthus annuus]
MAASSSHTSTTTHSNAICSCGTSTCIRTSWTKANPRRRFLCCSDNYGWLHWIEPQSTCPRCERVVPALLSS